MSRVILFDVDDTLISATSLGDANRELLFPQTTKYVFEKLQLNSDHIIVSSSVTRKIDIQTAFQNAGIECNHIEILGAEETSQLPRGDYGRKVNKALSAMTELNASDIIIIEDDTSIISTDEHVVHILVPTLPQNEMLQPQDPLTDNYLKMVLLPTEFLKTTIKPVVKNTIDTMRLGVIDHEHLNLVYDGALLSCQKNASLAGFFSTGFGKVRVASSQHVSTQPATQAAGSDRCCVVQ